MWIQSGLVKPLYILIYLGFTLVLMVQCASPSPPTGGPVDEDPPVLDTAASSPLMPTNFTEDEILLEFDEFIELSNPATSVVISPPLQYNPEYLVRGRRLFFKFDSREELRENTTYTINFGDAIRDFTEGNILRNLVYVFSTGPEIDSLEMSVRMVDAYTGEPISNALAVLHEPGKDSALLKSKPLYFSASDENGLAKIQFIQEGNYALFGLVDENRNYLYDLPGELVGFYDQMVVLPDTAESTREIRLFQREDRFLRESRRWRDGVTLAMKYNRPFESMEFEFPESPKPIAVTSSGDTVLFHYYKPVTDSVMVTAISLPDTRDTTYSSPPRDSGISPLRPGQIESALKPGEPAMLRFNHLIDTFDKALIEFVSGDTLPEGTEYIRFVDIIDNKVAIDIRLEEGKRSQFLILPGAFTDIHGNQNDSISLSLNRQDRSSFANLELTVDSLDKDEQYILILENQSGEANRKIVSGKKTFNWQLNNIRPDNYMLRVVWDQNKNRRWDPGVILERIQPEAVSTHEIVQLRANWDFEQTVIPFQE